ncbi:MAG: glycosyltransferase [Candidatus Omnitrophica bacterium]|nr:glycosyltransferase [Candidatus Omnitrophota bacterium]MDD5488136.1 glycosyltransferase [Candidatus Omnitrophota bacterium]
MGQNKKIVVLYSTAGLGHKKAALALVDAFKERIPTENIDLIDVNDYANKLYRFLYLDAYVFMMSRAKWLWGILYYFSNLPFVDLITKKLRNMLDYKSLPGLASALKKKDPDVIVSTHFLLPSIAGLLRKSGLNSQMFVVVTDYGPHSYWLSPDIDVFFVGAVSAGEEMVKRGVDRARIFSTGIPTEGVFDRDLDKAAISADSGLDQERRTIFLMSGGFGVGPMVEMLMELNRCKADIQVIAVCGHNKAAFDNINRIRHSLQYPLKLFGFTDKVAELMAVSDIMITKAGGISVTEALNSRLPMILFGSIPGQETWNEAFLVSGGAAEKAHRIKDIPELANRMLLSMDVYDAHKAALESLRRPNAAKKIADIVLSWGKESPYNKGGSDNG